LAAAHVRERPVAVPLDLEQPAGALRHILLESRQHRAVDLPLRRRGIAAFPDEQPVLRVAVEMRRHERPQPVEPLAAQPDSQPAVLLLLDELVRPAIPDLDGTRAVLAL